MKTYITLFVLLMSTNAMAYQPANVFDRSTDILFNTTKNTVVTKVNKELASVNPQLPGIAHTAYKDVTEGTNGLESSPNVVDLITSTVYKAFK